MKKPATISIGLHAAILFAALVGFSAPKPFVVKPIEAIQVDISTISDKTQQMALAKEAAPKPDKPAPKPTKIVKDVPPAPKVADEIKTAAHEPVKQEPTPPEPKPDPTRPEPKVEPPKPVEPTPLADDALKKLMLDDQKKVDDQKKAEELKKKAETKKKAEEKKQRAEKLAAVEELVAKLNKIQGESTAPAKPSKDEGAPKLAAKDNQGNDAAMTATIIDALVSKVKGCMNVPPAAREANIAVRIHFLLNPDGSVNGQPEIQSMNSDPIFDATARAAVSAILECQNYELPKDQYELWKDNTLDFNPNLLFGT